MIRWAAIVTVVASIGSLVACSTGGAAPTVTRSATTTVTRTITATVTVAPASASPSAVRTAAAATRGLPLGRKFTVKGDGVIAVVNKFIASSHDDGTPDKGHRYADLKIRVCSPLRRVTVSSAPWSLVGADGSNNDEMVSGGGIHDPQYPSSGDLLYPGDCVTGWIAFEVPTSERIVAAKYSPSGTNGKLLPYGKWDLR